MQLNRNGFTLIEIMVVVVTLGILAAVVVPKFAGAHTSASIAAAGEDILAMTQALENHNTVNGYWPAETAAGVSPPEVISRFKGESPFEKACPIGSVYDYNNKTVSGVSIISIEIQPSLTSPAPSIVDAQELDIYLDDGVLNTGRFQSSGNGYAYRISP